MPSFRPVALALAVAGALMAPALAQAPQTPPARSLYQRLGGYDAIAAVSDEFINRLAGDPVFVRFFSSFSTDSKLRLRQHLVEQLCQGAGGPCYYTGRTMRQSHTGLKITEAEWRAAAAHLIGAMDKFHIPPPEEDEVIAFVTRQKPDIVGQ